MAKRLALAAVIGRMVAMGELSPNEPLTAGKLCELSDIAEGTGHGEARRAEFDRKAALHSEARASGEDYDDVLRKCNKAEQAAEDRGEGFDYEAWIAARAEKRA